MPKLTAYVANLLIGGDEVTHLPNDSWVRDFIRFNCNGRQFLFRQNLDVISEKFKSSEGRPCNTTTVEVENIDSSELTETLETINSICWLLSFATQSRVMCSGHDYADGATTGCRQPIVGAANHFRPVFDFNDSVLIKSFIEKTYPTYKQLVEKRKLYAVFEYLYQAERATQPTEIRLLLLFICLENLKDTYAKDKGLPFIEGAFRKPKKQQERIGKPYSFRELLTKMFRTVHMLSELQQIVNLRNEIVHSGLSHKSHSEQVAIYQEVLDLLREYILRLLNYRGDYQTYSMRTLTM